MFRELVTLGRDLEQEGKLPPPGFYDYGEPIRWIVHLLPDRAILEYSEMPAARPYSGRTSGREAHLLADEAGYALGVARKDDGSEDARAKEKHRLFRDLSSAFLVSEELRDPALRGVIEDLQRVLDNGEVSQGERFGEITSKQWVSFVPEHGPLSGTHLFQHPEAKAFWLVEMQRRCATLEKDEPGHSAMGMCAVCGKSGERLVRKLPVGVKLAGTVPLTSLNEDAFTSFIGGGDTAKKAHLGLCFRCGDTAARAFNFLGNSSLHRRLLLLDQRPGSRDKLTNQIALFWLKAPGPIRVEEAVIDFNDLAMFDLGAVAAPSAPSAELSQLHTLLKLPWQPVDAAFRLDDYGFYLAVLSPNVGRIALREWIATTLAQLKSNLVAFLDATTIVTEGGDVRPVSIRTIVDAIGSKSPNLTRALLRSAYAGGRPTKTFAIQAGQRLNHIQPNEASLRDRQNRGRPTTPVWDERWPHALAATIKLALFYGSEEAQSMVELNPLFRSQAYHCGRLLAVLEEAQQRYHYRRHGERLDTTIVNRSYGGAASAPKTTFAPLFRLASTSHLPESPRWLEEEVEAISSSLVELGGMPATLSLPEQAEFGLGFYHQRADLRARRAARSTTAQDSRETGQA
jgi:CRISPR-associated protein Csd1